MIDVGAAALCVAIAVAANPPRIRNAAAVSVLAFLVGVASLFGRRP